MMAIGLPTAIPLDPSATYVSQRRRVNSVTLGTRRSEKGTNNNFREDAVFWRFDVDGSLVCFL
jgi:hypothetical protein